MQSSTPSTYVEVIYTYNNHGYYLHFDQTIDVGPTAGIAEFPVLPSSSIEIRVGNTNPIYGATETVYITNFY